MQKVEPCFLNFESYNMDIHQIILAASEAVEQAAHPEQSDLLGTLGINWKLFIAQLVNFVIVLAIFWKWIAKPLSKTLSDRQERIASGLKNAELQELEKKNFDQWKKEEMRKTRDEAEQILKSTSVEADKIKQETIAAAQDQAKKLAEQAMASIANEKDR